MYTLTFWKQTFERALKSFAQAVLAGLGGISTGLLDVPWAATLNLAALLTLASVLTSVISVLRDTDSGVPTPSLVSLTPSRSTRSE